MDDLTPQCNSSSQEYPCNDQGTQYALIIIPVFLGVTTVLTITLILWKTCCRKWEQERAPIASLQDKPVSSESGYVAMAAVEHTLLPVRDPGLRQWEIPGDTAIEDLEFLRSGRFGPVCRAKLTQGGSSTAVVIKTLRDNSTTSKAKEFVNWIRFCARVCCHDNLVKMMFCQTELWPMYLIMEACSPGNLLHLLWELRKSDGESVDQVHEFSETSVYCIGKQVLAGLDYLASEQKLIHGDVAARNVLINSRLGVKISGLSLAFEVQQTGCVSSRSAAVVPVKWLAPERIMKLPMTVKSDIWSFGILLYELITLGSPPYPELKPLDTFPKLQHYYRMKRPDHCGAPLYDLMKHCWMWLPQDRPSFSAVIKHLDSYMYLAETKMICNKESMNMNQYSLIAGVVL
ncbi:tyrosine-protein kinase STYK1 isoform X1 [Lepisosteus oculatus]|uniref:Si:ch73-206d17.1 n=1 Tax=Lepisosteus oculatus TaxID=7918 RepID=W5LX42_LEPOC|nr:PREDICTED: tyrosine-protein kinase STYK1-like isoform X1 [Lepisosteus oculatus]XP_015192254.1 PREDICTED: tyrosine-protein kinase STYK1-like isoform X1 [Lepisosteus oculatus]